MDDSSVRKFNSAPGEPSNAGGYTTSLFTGIGTRSGVITAYYEHVSSVIGSVKHSSTKDTSSQQRGALAAIFKSKRSLPGIAEEGHYANLCTNER